MLRTFCPLTIWAISLEFSGKPSILEADDFLGACCRKAMTHKKLWILIFPQSCPSQAKTPKSTSPIALRNSVKSLWNEWSNPSGPNGMQKMAKKIHVEVLLISQTGALQATVELHSSKNLGERTSKTIILQTCPNVSCNSMRRSFHGDVEVTYPRRRAEYGFGEHGFKHRTQ